MANLIASAIASTIFNKVMEAVSQPHVPVSDANAETVAAAVTKTVAPIVENATNSEPLYKSRVAWGSAAVVLGSISDLCIMYATNTWDQQRIITALVTISGAAFALYGRIFGSKLKPLGE